MSQWGAQGMATGGATYREILAAFYPGTKLVEARP
jgi:SpoIID/LytB domain protein